MDAQTPDELLHQARRGDADAWGALLTEYRPYLRVLAERDLDSAVKARVDASDIVQQTCLEAHRDLGHFQGTGAAELLAWLRRILDNNLAEMVARHIVARKRSTRNETALDATLASDVPVCRELTAEVSSPSRRAMRGEDAARLARALESLPSDQREAVRLRHLEGWTLCELALRLERSEVAVAGLLKRGLQQLRRVLQSPTRQP